jgi:hypothetical protein
MVIKQLDLLPDKSRLPVDDGSVPPEGLIGALIVGCLFGGLLVYALAARGPDGKACFADTWNALSLVVGLASGFITALYFEYRGVKRAMRDGSTYGLNPRDAYTSYLVAPRTGRFGFIAFLGGYFRPRRKLELPAWPAQ